MIGTGTILSMNSYNEDFYIYPNLDFSLQYKFSKRLYIETGISTYISWFKSSIIWIDINSATDNIRYDYNFVFKVPLLFGYNIINNEQYLLSYNVGIEKFQGIRFYSKIKNSITHETISSWGNDRFFNDIASSLIDQYYFFSTSLDFSCKTIFKNQIIFICSYKNDFFSGGKYNNTQLYLGIRYKF
ncbi:MAG: hypothetical protein Kow0068_06930 [Marinilabiliales bacterium]